MSDNTRVLNDIRRIPYRVLNCQMISNLVPNTCLKITRSSPSPVSSNLSASPIKDSPNYEESKLNEQQNKKSPVMLRSINEPKQKNDQGSAESPDLTESWDPEHRRSYFRSVTMTDPIESSVGDSRISYFCLPPARNGFENGDLQSKGPIEARTDKLICMNKNLFQPKTNQFHSPKIVKANPRSVCLTPNSQKKSFSSNRVSAICVENSVRRLKVEAIMNRGQSKDEFQRVTQHFLLDNYWTKLKPSSTRIVNVNSSTPQKITSKADNEFLTPTKDLPNISRSLSFNHAYYGNGRAYLSPEYYKCLLPPKQNLHNGSPELGVNVKYQG